MTFATLTGEERSRQWPLYLSLAVNLFFVGIIGALIVRTCLAEPPVEEHPRTAEARIERLAVTLPPADAAKLRAEFKSQSTTAESARINFDDALENVRKALRAQPFDEAALRAAMTKARAGRQGLDQILQDIIARAASDMSFAGRDELASWTPISHRLDASK